MDGRKSKFEFCCFRGGFDYFAANKEKYSIEQALELYKREMDAEPGEMVAVYGDAFVRHRAGINEDNEPCVGWWLEYYEEKRSCPVWAMHPVYKGDSKFNSEYAVYVLK